MDRKQAFESGRQAALARRNGDETLASHITRKEKETWPAYATDERRELEAEFNDGYKTVVRSVQYFR